jgi:hypothetical protein
MQSQIERENQLMDKKRMLDQNIYEEQVYAELWRQDMLKKEAREKKEREEKQQAVKETLNVLNWQNQQRTQAEGFSRTGMQTE